jgi:hypothetical protein
MSYPAPEPIALVQREPRECLSRQLPPIALLPGFVSLTVSFCLGNYEFVWVLSDDRRRQRFAKQMRRAEVPSRSGVMIFLPSMTRDRMRIGARHLAIFGTHPPGTPLDLAGHLLHSTDGDGSAGHDFHATVPPLAPGLRRWCSFAMRIRQIKWAPWAGISGIGGYRALMVCVAKH